MKSTISSKGQVTIPVKVRKALGLQPGDRVSYKVVGDVAELMPVKGSILDAAGSLHSRGNTRGYAGIRRAVKEEVAKRAAKPVR